MYTTNCGGWEHDPQQVGNDEDPSVPPVDEWNLFGFGVSWNPIDRRDENAFRVLRSAFGVLLREAIGQPQMQTFNSKLERKTLNAERKTPIRTRSAFYVRVKISVAPVLRSR